MKTINDVLLSKKLIELGYEVQVSLDGEYYRLCKDDNPIIADSADEDLYSADTAEAYFNNYGEEYIKEHTIEFYELLKGNYGHDTLTYFADGIEIEVTGDFYVDRQGILHHTHIFDDGEEMDVTCQYK